MLLHITPKFLTAHAFSTAGLASVEIPEFRLKLSGEKELMTRKALLEQTLLCRMPKVRQGKQRLSPGTPPYR